MLRLLKLTLLLFFLEIMIISPCAGQPAKITILLIDRLSLEDLHTLAGPFCAEKIQSSSYALMTTNTAGPRTAGNTHATLAAGAPALSDRPGGLALNFEEKWMGITGGELYRQLSGEHSPQAAVFIPQIAEAVRLNYSASRIALPTLLGSTLKQNNLSCSVLGNSDPAPPVAGHPYTPYARFAPWLAADAAGLVDRGDIGPQTIQRSTGLIPWESNYQYLFEKYCTLRAETDLIILELGDFSRLETLIPYLFDQQVSTEKKRLFSRLEQFLQDLWPVIDFEQEMLILASPTPTSAALKTGNTLTPLLFWGKGTKPGFMTSPTTRRLGLVANLDLTPTILKLFGLDTPAFASGRPITYTATGNLEALLRMNQSLVRTTFFRRQTLPLFLSFSALALPFLLALYLFATKIDFSGSASYHSWWLGSIYFLSLLPLSLLLTSQLTINSFFSFIAVSVGSSALFALSYSKLSAKFNALPLQVPFFILALIIMADLFSGNHLIQNSIFGYDPMAGARYYGLGNESAGLYLGTLAALLIFWFPTRSRFVTRSFFGIFLGSALLLAAPFTGANFGAGLSAVASALTLLYVERKSSRPTHQLLRYLLYLALFALLFLCFDYFRGDLENQTHFGLLLKNLRARGPSAVMEVIRRKLRVNLRLLSSKWTLLSVSGLTTLLVTCFSQRKHFTLLPLSVVLSGGLAGLLLNDSGLVFSALYFYLCAVALLLKAATWTY
ncbi:MAG: hypothetical protein GX050_02565 [Firmicutes bacterium]|nr:hypothetical protein [Bacillota bacterium]